MTLTRKQLNQRDRERRRVPVGSKVVHRDASARGTATFADVTGRVLRYGNASVGAPSMAWVEWASGSTSKHNTRNLEVVR